MKFNLHGIAAALTSTLALLLSPAVLNILPPKAAAVVGALGIVYQAFSKPAAQPTPTAAKSSGS